MREDENELEAFGVNEELQSLKGEPVHSNPLEEPVPSNPLEEQPEPPSPAAPLVPEPPPKPVQSERPVPSAAPEQPVPPVKRVAPSEISTGHAPPAAPGGSEDREFEMASAFEGKRWFYQKDVLWLTLWLSVMAGVGIWNLLFLNKPALKQVTAGLFNTFFISFQVIAYTLALAWLVTLALYFLESKKIHAGYLVLTFLLNLTRSVPQIVGVLFGYVWLTFLIRNGSLRSSILIFALMALMISTFILVELVDLMRERIQYFKNLDFYNAMRVCGISEGRIINFHVLWKNSRVHIFNKLIAVFGMAIFLQCSVDFIVSVGLSLEVDLVTMPTTLGSLLANIDSKQDILAIGYTITHPGYLGSLFFKHLQGITVSFLMVFSLLSIYHISNGYAERHRL